MAEPDVSLLRDPASFTDPFPAYDALRGHSPLQVGRSSWIVLSYDHVRQVLADPERFSSNVRASDNPVFRDSPLVFDDPPRHTHIRRIIAKAFTPRRVAEAEPWITAIADDLLDAWSPRRDVVASFCDPLPVFVIARMMGIATDRFRDFKQWSEDRSYVVFHSRGERNEALLSAERGAQAIMDWFAAMVAERRARPGDDLISALIEADADGERLTDDDVIGTCCVLLSAGNLTTTRLIGNILHLLASEPERYAQVRADRSLIAPLVEEVVRIDSPVQTPIRRTTGDVELGGKVIPAGSFVTIGIGAANRDAAAFEAPDEHRLGRETPHLAFGHGIHFCLGASLARLEAKIAIDRVAERFTELSLVSAEREAGSLAHRGFVEIVLDARGHAR